MKAAWNQMAKLPFYHSFWNRTSQPPLVYTETHSNFTKFLPHNLQWVQTEISLALGIPTCIDQIKIDWDDVVFTVTWIQASRAGFQLLEPQPWHFLLFLKKEIVKTTPMRPLAWIMVLLHFGVGPSLYVIPKRAWWELEGPQTRFPPFGGEHLERALTSGRAPISPKGKFLGSHMNIRFTRIPSL